MGTILKNVVRFTGLTIGVPVSLPHRLNVNGQPVAPRIGGANSACFTFTATTTQLTATRTVDAAAGDVDVYVEYWHTIESVLPLPGQLAGLTPLFFASCGGGGGGGPTTEHVSGEGGVDPTLPLDPAVDTSYITNTGPSESSQNFSLADGTEDGQIHNIVNETQANLVGVNVIPANLGYGTQMSASLGNASFSLIWNVNSGSWRILGTPFNFTQS